MNALRTHWKTSGGQPVCRSACRFSDFLFIGDMLYDLCYFMTCLTYKPNSLGCKLKHTLWSQVFCYSNICRHQKRKLLMTIRWINKFKSPRSRPSHSFVRNNGFCEIDILLPAHVPIDQIFSTRFSMTNAIYDKNEFYWPLWPQFLEFYFYFLKSWFFRFFRLYGL